MLLSLSRNLEYALHVLVLLIFLPIPSHGSRLHAGEIIVSIDGLAVVDRVAQALLHHLHNVTPEWHAEIFFSIAVTAVSTRAAGYDMNSCNCRQLVWVVGRAILQATRKGFLLFWRGQRLTLGFVRVKNTRYVRSVKNGVSTHGVEC